MKLFRRKDAEVPRPERLTQAEFDAARCAHCGGCHIRACPRVRSMKFERNGADLVEVTFWETYDDSNIVWPESIYDDEPEAEEDGVG